MREAEVNRSERIRAGNCKSVGSGRIYVTVLNIWQSRKGYRDCKVREAGRLENIEKYRKTNNSTDESVDERFSLEWSPKKKTVKRVKIMTPFQVL